MIKTLLLCLLLTSVYGETPEQWKTYFYVKGILYLPYAEISEPFTAYFDSTRNSSRVDYYDGMTKTFQLADTMDYGVMYKVAYMSTDSELNILTCFQSNGTSTAPVGLQSMLPDISNFNFIGKSYVRDIMCSTYQLVEVVGSKQSTYTIYMVWGTDIPVRYEMIGYDSLLGSHFDRYYLDYLNYSSAQPDVSVFHVDSSLECSGFPGPGSDLRHGTVNPGAEYLSGDMSHHQVLFKDFKAKYGRHYEAGEHEVRRNTFMQNVRFIHSSNRAGKSYSVTVNHLTDLNDLERRTMFGRKYTPGYNGGLPFPQEEFEGMARPDSIDWRLYGAVTPVKDQAVCGSCWSFGTTGTLEGQYFLKTKKLVRLSQQMLMDCSWGEGNNACDGGEDFRAYQWIMKHSSEGGLAVESDYGMYKGSDGMCKRIPGVVNITGYVNVTAYSEPALLDAIAFKGPISVAIDAAHKSLSFYANGVYYEPTCGNKPDQLDHAVLAVGYGTLDGKDYWLVKNSWSTYWGNDGYVLMSRKDNNCGVATDPTYPLL